jgi:deoxyribodipyrimidine photolyase
VVATAGVALDRDYPAPIVDLQATRARALERFASMAGRPAP